MAESKLRNLSMDFSVSVIRLCDKVRGHASLKNQLERAASSIGANIYEANYAQSRADFILKLHIALKECAESEYWLELLIDAGFYSDPAALELCREIKRLLIASLNTAKGGAHAEAKLL